MQGIPQELKLNIHEDARGQLLFNNDFTFSDIKRFYHIRLPKKNIIRAFHGHMIEKKYVYILRGTVLISVVKLTDTKNPSKDQKVQKYILQSKDPKILIIPPGFANGIMSIEDDSEVMFYSSLTLDESLKDDYRFPENYWGENVWRE